ncbi:MULTISPECIES: toll/interleukin-1 receptor domain-containing protein [Actinosynnema]|uniref:TIR domain-containing protein n=1 Tax=Actinosynnema TaxID=40566 RepID=UPI0020A5DFD8|nr:toll/interleukin-1 receptor domain-containing protein [Actinosynnema pretiosum]MCP2098471.1 TIR domain-containing protein [Actinosynnema pretiosum]
MRIFVNYRQRDPDGGLLPHALAVEALADRLAALFGEGSVHFDTTLPPGERYADVLRDRLAEATALVAVIHPGWPADLEARRDRHKDWVRAEIAEAARTGKRIIPVLLDGAEPPRHQDLDEDLHALADAQAVPLRFGAFDAGVEALAAEIELHVEPAEQPVVPRPEPLPDRGRLAGVLIALTAMLLLALVAPLTRSAPALLGSGAAVAVFALLPGIPLVVVLGMSAARFALVGPALWLDDLLTRVTDHKAYAVFGLGVVLVSLVLLLLVVTSALGRSPDVVGAVLVCSVGVLLVMGMLWARAQDSRLVWPQHVPSPTTTWARAELLELERRLRGDFPGWTRPLPMSARRTARAALDRLADILDSLAAQREAGRRSWWRARNPYLSAAHVGAALAAILVLTAALLVHWSEAGADGTSALWWLAGCAASALCCAGALELDYRAHRRALDLTLATVPDRAEAARARLADLSRTSLHAAHLIRAGQRSA